MTQNRILSYIRAHPHCSYHEIVAGCGVSSTSVARYHVQRLVAAGLVNYTPGIARSMHAPDAPHVGANVSSVVNAHGWASSSVSNSPISHGK